MTSTDTPSTDATPWWKDARNIQAILTVLTLLLGVFGYTVSAQDYQTLVGGGSTFVAIAIQLWGVIRHILATKASS